jgi:hypothetical protein
MKIKEIEGREKKGNKARRKKYILKKHFRYFGYGTSSSIL